MLLAMLVLMASSTVAHAEVPLRTDQASPALVEMDGWQIFAADMSVDGPRVSFKDVHASAYGPNGWTLSAERLDMERAPSREVIGGLCGDVVVCGDVVWWRARGIVRVTGPDDLYVTAEQAVSFQPQRILQFIGAAQPPTAGAAEWRLAARSILVELASGRVEYDRPISGPAHIAGARAGGITRRLARTITGAPSIETAKDQEPSTKHQEHPRDGEIAFRLTGAESAHINVRPTNQE